MADRPGARVGRSHSLVTRCIQRCTRCGNTGFLRSPAVAPTRSQSTHVSPSATDERPRSDGSRGDHAYRELKARLLAGEFGINVRLGEERLAASVGVSRTPI